MMNVRRSVKILLFNDKKELLLICVEDPKTSAVDGTHQKRFWAPVGGGIDPGETMLEAAVRELEEETGLTEGDVTFGQHVWFGQFDYLFLGERFTAKQDFIIAHTKKTEINFDNLTEEERIIVTDARWFSVEDLKNCKDTVYPVILADLLPDILHGKYGQEPVEVDLAKQPKK